MSFDLQLEPKDKSKKKKSSAAPKKKPSKKGGSKNGDSTPPVQSPNKKQKLQKHKFNPCGSKVSSATKAGMDSSAAVPPQPSEDETEPQPVLATEGSFVVDYQNMKEGVYQILVKEGD